MNNTKSQAEKLLNYLKTGRKINVTSPVKRKLKIGYLNSRVSQLGKEGHLIDRKDILVKNSDGDKIRVKEYWMA
jgi:hypothetical protein